MLFKRAYEKGYEAGMKEGARIAVDVLNETIATLAKKAEEDIKVGGTDEGEDDED